MEILYLAMDGMVYHETTERAGPGETHPLGCLNFYTQARRYGKPLVNTRPARSREGKRGAGEPDQ
jgi:hypothetical protein